MRFRSKNPGGSPWFCIPFSSKRRKRANDPKDIQLPQSVRRDPTPTPAVEALELELAEERAKCARLERERRAEADAMAEAKGKMENEIREVRDLLEAREKEVGQKDVSAQQLERDASEMRTKVS